MRDSIDTRVDESELQRIGFVVDADENVAERWHSLGDALRSAGYTAVPANPDPAGTIIPQDGKATVGILADAGQHVAGCAGGVHPPVGARK